MTETPAAVGAARRLVADGLDRLAVSDKLGRNKSYVRFMHGVIADTTAPERTHISDQKGPTARLDERVGRSAEASCPRDDQSAKVGASAPTVLYCHGYAVSARTQAPATTGDCPRGWLIHAATPSPLANWTCPEEIVDALIRAPGG
jgi:hypothetical protein